MPSDSKTTDRRPAATEAATDEATRQAVQDAIENAVESLIDGQVEAARFLSWLAQDGYTVVPITTAAPPSGQVCVSVEDVNLSLEIVYDYHNDQDYFENMPPNIRAYVDRLRAALEGASE